MTAKKSVMPKRYILKTHVKQKKSLPIKKYPYQLNGHLAYDLTMK